MLAGTYWLVTRRLQLVVNGLGVPVALIDRGPLLSAVMR